MPPLAMTFQYARHDLYRRNVLPVVPLSLSPSLYLQKQPQTEQYQQITPEAQNNPTRNDGQHRLQCVGNTEKPPLALVVKYIKLKHNKKQ